MARHPTAVVVAVIGLLVAASAADAAKMHKHQHHAGARMPTRHAMAPRPPALVTQTVVYGDRVLGADPDLNIRYQLLRDLGAVFGPNGP
jgi:hypothetical protein